MTRENTFICEICGCETPKDCESGTPNVCCGCIDDANDEVSPYAYGWGDIL